MKINYKKNYKIFLKKLKNTRLELNLSQKEVSKRLNKKDNYMNRLESGLRKCDIIVLMELSNIYDKEIDYFLSNL